MSRIWVTSDLHFNHNNIKNFSPIRDGNTSEDHDRIIIEKWNSVVNKKDSVYILGDVAFNAAAIDKIILLKGNKILIGGNHDKNLNKYSHLNIFSTINGCRILKGYWLTHIPIHPLELRGRKNIHGHTHSVSIQDENYINVCVDITNGYPVLLQDIIDGSYFSYKETKKDDIKMADRS